MFSYRINQFEVESEVQLPCVSRSAIQNLGQQTNSGRRGCALQTGVPQPLYIEKRPSLDEVSQLQWIGQRWWARSYDTGDGVAISVQDTMRLHVDRQVSRIAVAYNANDRHTSAMAGACLINLGMSVCSLLRGEVALHGAAVEWGGRVVAFMAPSGTGKSTLLWALRNAGFRFVSDDVLIVRSSRNSIVGVPSYGLHSKLDGEGLSRQGWSSADYEEVLPDSDEYWIPVEAEHRVFEPLPIAGLFVLSPSTAAPVTNTTAVPVTNTTAVPVTNTTAAPSFSPLSLPVTFNRQSSGAAMSHITENIQALWAVHNVVPAAKLMAGLHQLAERVPLYVVNYPRTYDVLPALISGVQNLLEHPDQVSLEGRQSQRFPRGISGRFSLRPRTRPSVAVPVASV